jgi:hypothetical protein
MNEVNSPTRRYVASTSDIPECCKSNEHSSIKEAFECILLKENDPLEIKIDAIDWAFGERAIVPTFGSEWKEIWQEIDKYRTLAASPADLVQDMQDGPHPAVHGGKQIKSMNVTKIPRGK